MSSSPDLSERKTEAEKVLARYPDRVPVICEASKKRKSSPTLPVLDKRKFLVPRDLSMSQLFFVVRKRMKLKSDQALFFFVGNQIPNGHTSVGETYDTYRAVDGFLYVNYSSENTFG